MGIGETVTAAATYLRDSRNRDRIRKLQISVVCKQLRTLLDCAELERDHQRTPSCACSVFNSLVVQLSMSFMANFSSASSASCLYVKPRPSLLARTISTRGSTILHDREPHSVILVKHAGHGVISTLVRCKRARAHRYGT